MKISSLTAHVCAAFGSGQRDLLACLTLETFALKNADVKFDFAHYSMAIESGSRLELKSIQNMLTVARKFHKLHASTVARFIFTPEGITGFSTWIGACLTSGKYGSSLTDIGAWIDGKPSSATVRRDKADLDATNKKLEAHRIAKRTADALAQADTAIAAAVQRATMAIASSAPASYVVEVLPSVPFKGNDAEPAPAPTWTEAASVATPDPTVKAEVKAEFTEFKEVSKDDVQVKPKANTVDTIMGLANKLTHHELNVLITRLAELAEMQAAEAVETIAA